ncbi:uncharacterized protein BJ171DRAFT_466681 [Polychytrium aggregatum]|uniref:uncharacterized protein n=1 Tax=Polychytrium aggregatum TaxID=110093 RepID=UPI0022FE2C1C|nr:uncharacterized protein BJ171DRAFT_466681 [Polychytrium aggregatum]KAI9193055.1 hypothetical protein BJ171DRAFT_466681 [Polychytrium aggregatum]
MVGWMYYLGRGTVQDVQKGVKIIRDNKSFTFRLGEDNCLAVFSGANSDSTASQKFFEFCLLGSQQDWLCRHLMAVCLLYGFGTMQDRTKAARIFEELANDGHSDSQFWIGMCYCCGGGVSQDRSKAAEWFGKSADLGNSYGQWWVGVSYLGGFGVTQDLPKAVEWLHKSAEQGNRYGQNDLGYCYRRGCGVTENIGTALYWFRKSAEQGHDAAIDSLGDLNKRL